MDGYNFGVWAGDLAYHEGLWYCYQIDFKHGLYVSTSSDIRGPWSKPHKMLPVDEVFTDPAVFWDYETHKAYLICNTGEKQKAPENETPGFESRIYQMSWDGKEIIDEGKVVYTAIGAEAAKIYKLNKTWYIFMAEWFIENGEDSNKRVSPKNDRKQIVLRSKSESIYGPYEKKIVLERGNGIERSCSQGALMQAPDSSWWYIHQLIQNIETPFQGRPQCLEPVTWLNGWPVIGEDIDNDGVGEPVIQYEKPIHGFPVNAPQSDDDFSDSKLGEQWEWNHNPRNTYWSLTERPGWLRLKAGLPVKPETYGERNKTLDTFWRAYNTLSQRIMGTTTGVATARFDLSFLSPGQRAGFVRFGGVYHLLGVVVEDSGKKNLFFMDNKENEQKGPEILTNIIYLRTSNMGNQAYFEYSIDGESFERFGPDFTIKFGKWTGDRLGFFCWKKKKKKGFIDIDWFHYNYDGPKKSRIN